MDARGHEQGSRKARVHELFDEEGAEVAFTLGKRVRLKEATLHSWFGAWRRQDKKATSQDEQRGQACRTNGTV